MGSVSASKVLLHIFNVVSVVLGLALAAASVWFFLQVHEFTSLRNANHYLLDYNVYWPQAIPWMFFIVAVFVLSVCCCGFTSASKNSRGIITVYLIFLVLVTLCLIAAAVVALLFADNETTDDFVKDTVWDVYFQAKTDNEVANAFGAIERKLHCCGADSPRDYKSTSKNKFPMSCCDNRGSLEPYVDCEFTNQFANERHGCSKVAMHYARIVIKILSGASIFTAVIAVISFMVALSLSRALTKKITRAKHESVSKKVPL